MKDGKIHLHKMNGVKIAVPVVKMSRDDIEYVEKMTGIPLREDKTQVDSRKSRAVDKPSGSSPPLERNKSKNPEYDWFQFFLDCDIAVGLCERYAQAFNKDSMDESVLPDVNDHILRTLGLREGDIIKVMRTLDAKFGRQRSKEGDGGLFSGPGGALRNNTRKGRPAPTTRASDVVDASALSSKEKSVNIADSDDKIESPPPTSPAKANTSGSKDPPAGGFDDDAWDVKPNKRSQSPPQQTRAPPASTVPAAGPSPGLTGSMKELSLLSEPLQPVKGGSAHTNAPSATTSPSVTIPEQRPSGADPSFFSTLAQSQQSILPQGPRQRPTPTQTSPPPGTLVPPPPQRPLSAPQTAQPSAFTLPAMPSQMTGAIQTQVAPLGQSLSEIGQARLQQQQLLQQQQQQQQYAAELQKANYLGHQGVHPQGMVSYPPAPHTHSGQFMHPMMTGVPNQSPFADPGRVNTFTPLSTQPTGFQSQFGSPQTYNLSQGGLNNFLPPPLEPQRTSFPGASNPQVHLGGLGQQQPPEQPLQPLIPQQTGPAPPVRFGVAPEAKKLAPQPTGRRANLSQASK